MLDLLMFAAEPGGLFGARPEAMGWWTQYIQPILGPILAFLGSFAGFTVGTYISHRYAIRREQINREEDRQDAAERRQREQHAIAAALIGELRALWQQCETRLYTYTNLLKESPKREVFAPGSISQALPDRKAWEAYLPRIGELGPMVALKLSSMYGRFDEHDAAVKVVIPISPGLGWHRSSVEDFTRFLALLVRDIKDTVNFVSQSIGAGTPSWSTTDEMKRMAEFFQQAEPAPTKDATPPARP